jgi:hypothetical protein
LFWCSTFGLCVKLVLNLSTVLNWFSTFQPCVKMVLAVKCWMENADVTNGLFLILKISNMACQLKYNEKKKKKNINKIYIYIDF